MDIQEITYAEKAQYCLYIRKGLAEDQESFRISPNDPQVFPTKDSVDSFTLGAYECNQIIGVVSFDRDGSDREKLRHKGWLVRMLVDSAHRGKGIGSALILALIGRVRTIEGIERINLTVMSSDARRLYEKLGFVCFAEEPEAVKFEGEYFTEYQMSMKL